MPKHKMISTSSETVPGLWEGFPDPRGVSLKGTERDDTLQGGSGHDTLDGAGGNDALFGGQGDDTYVWGPNSGSDFIHDAFGTDAVHIDAASTAVILSADTDDGSLMIRLNGNTLQIKDYFNDVGIPEHLELGHIEKLIFSDGVVWDLDKVLEILSKPQPAPNPTGLLITGTSGNDILKGSTGHDTIDGGAGDDALFGGKGNDVYVWRDARGFDLIEDTGGVDTVQIGAASSAVKLQMHLDGTLVVSVDGSALTIRSYLATSENGGHIEKLAFSDGAVWNLVKVLEILSEPKPHPEPEPVPEPEGEIVIGQKGNDVLLGTLDDDTLMGGIGHDTIDGGAGNDILIGGQGKDVLTGGTGEDFFVFAKKADLGLGSARDSINDFEIGIDLIDLGKIDANTATKKNDPFKALLKGKAAFTKAGQLHYDVKTGILSGNTDKDAKAEFQILLKNKPKALHLDDFIL